MQLTTVFGTEHYQYSTINKNMIKLYFTNQISAE